MSTACLRPLVLALVLPAAIWAADPLLTATAAMPAPANEDAPANQTDGATATAVVAATISAPETSLLAATAIASPVPPGSFLGMTYQFQATGALPGRCRALVQLLDAKGKAAWSDGWPLPVATDAASWNGTVAFAFKRALPKTVPEGTYRVALQLTLENDKKAKLPLTAGPGVTLDKSHGFIVGSVTVDAKAPYPAADSDTKPTLDLTGMKMTFEEDFSKPLDVSPFGPGTRWIAHTPWKGDFGDARFVDPGESFPFTITPAPEHHLKMEARKNADGKWEAGLLASMDPQGNGFGQIYGYFACTAKFPAGNGVWPAFWLIEPRAGGPETSIEIDIVEHYGRNPNAYSSTIHTWKPAPHRAVGVQIQTRPGQVADGFHTYGAMVDRDFITEYFDGVAVWKTPTPPEHRKPLMLLVNLALGPGWPVDKTASSFTMEVSSLRAYAKPGDEPPAGGWFPASATAAAPATAAPPRPTRRPPPRLLRNKHLNPATTEEPCMPSTSAQTLPAISQRLGDDYLVSLEDRRRYRERGYITLDDVVNAEELAVIEAAFDRFSAGGIPGMERDFCDMSGSYGDALKDFALINAMLPRRYLPSLQGNIFERLSHSIARQLLGPDMALDYDQFLSKKPRQARAAFAMHQDMGYWPVGTPDTRTATCSLAITDSLLSNGCIRFVPGSQSTQKLLPHRAKGGADRNDSHTLELDLPADAEILPVEVRRGSISVHDEWIVHGSGGNPSEHWRKTYVIAYRSQATVAHERAIGFTHSHNDTVNWRTALDLAR